MRTTGIKALALGVATATLILSCGASMAAPYASLKELATLATREGDETIDEILTIMNVRRREGYLCNYKREIIDDPQNDLKLLELTTDCYNNRLPESPDLEVLYSRSPDKQWVPITATFTYRKTKTSFKAFSKLLDDKKLKDYGVKKTAEKIERQVKYSAGDVQFTIMEKSNENKGEFLIMPLETIRRVFRGLGLSEAEINKQLGE